VSGKVCLLFVGPVIPGIGHKWPLFVYINWMFVVPGQKVNLCHNELQTGKLSPNSSLLPFKHSRHQRQKHRERERERRRRGGKCIY